MRKYPVLVVFAAIAVCAVLVTACGPKGPDNTAPEKSVQGLLELRSGLSSDVAAYNAYLLDSTYATALADSTVNETRSPIPMWREPVERVKASTSTAQVRVRWIPSDRFPAWEKATIFLVVLDGGKWKVSDAAPDTSTAKPPTSETTAKP